MVPSNSSRNTRNAKSIAIDILNSIPRHLLPGFLLLKAHSSKTYIRRQIREVVRQSSRALFSTVMEGRIASELIKLLNLRKYKRRKKHERSDNR